MSLAALFEKIKAASPELDHRNGERFRRKEDSYPRVIWVKRGGPITAAVGQGGDGVTAGNPTYSVARHPLRTRNVQIDLHIWGADSDHCEAMIDRFVSAALQIAPGSIEFGDEEWLDQEQTVKHGELVVLGMTVVKPILERKTVVTTPTNLEQTAQMDFNGNIHTDHTSGAP